MTDEAQTDMTAGNWVPPLLTWYRRRRRLLPWRMDASPYRVWVSEVMLQQTHVDAVQPFFARFIERFPDVRALAAADLQEVLKAWEGLGYYSRARHLHRAAQTIVADLGGRLPRTCADLRRLPGIGPYTAAAIASICFGEAVPVVDGNVLRVVARLYARTEDISRQSTKTRFAALLLPVIDTHAPGDFNQAFMELGALICRPQAPACTACPVAASCLARAAHCVNELPVRKRRGPTPHLQVAVGIIRRDGQILIGRRPETAMLGGLWEFPGGKTEPGETAAATARREILEETGLNVTIDEHLCTVDHAYSHFSVTITAFLCSAPTGAGVAGSQPMRWVTPAELADYPLPRANRRIVEELHRHLHA